MPNVAAKGPVLLSSLPQTPHTSCPASVPLLFGDASPRGFFDVSIARAIVHRHRRAAVRTMEEVQAVASLCPVYHIFAGKDRNCYRSACIFCTRRPSSLWVKLTVWPLLLMLCGWHPLAQGTSRCRHSPGCQSRHRQWSFRQTQSACPSSW